MKLGLTFARKARSGFSIIGVIISLAILSIVIVATLNVIDPLGQFKKARDGRRKSDLNQYRVGLEAYAAAHDSLYPTHTSEYRVEGVSGDDNDLCDDLTDPVAFLDSCPADPVNSGSNRYYYVSDASGYEAALYVSLENGDTWVVCTGGKSGETSNLPATFCGF